MKKVNGHEIIQLFEQFAPKSYAMEGDRVGLQVGRLNGKVEKVLVALDVLEEVIDEAIEKKAQLIIAHHPIIYRPLQDIKTDTLPGRLFEKLIKHDIAVYAAHTNLDVASGGVNDMLSEAIGLKNAEVLVRTHETQLKKIVVFVPVEHADAVKSAMGKAGAGSIGNYSCCFFEAEGKGSFLPGENTNPFIGKPGKLETVNEARVETIVPEHLAKKVISVMIKAHPYEEVAYDIYPVENQGEVLGLGRIGEVEEMTLKDFAEKVKVSLDVEHVRVVGNLSSKIKKAAVLGGDGNKYWPKAKFRGADVYITGDIYYHTAHDAMMQGLNIIDPGHNIEKIMKKGVAQVMSRLCESAGYEVAFIASETDTSPFQFV